MMHEEFEEKYRKSLESIQFPKALRNHIRCVCCLKESRDNCTLLVTDGNKKYVLKIAEGSRGASLEREKDILNELEQAGVGMVPASVFFLKEEKTVYYMREYVEGDNLLAVVKKHGCMAGDTLTATALQLCELLEILHSQEISIVHGDMKPENIICKRNHRFILIDFETARRLKSRETPDFRLHMCRRTLTEHPGADCRTDIYGLGITLLYLACGSYDRKDLRTAGIPLRLRRIIRKCLAYDPRRSYRNVGELRKTLLRCRKHHSRQSPRHTK